MCEVFQAFVDFKEVYINGISDDFESKEVELSLDFLGNKIGSMQDDNLILINGAHSIKQNFILKSEPCLENEELFKFQAFGCSVKIQLILKKLSEGKSKRKSEKLEILFADGSINLLLNLKDIVEKCKQIHRVNLNVPNSENTEVTLTYEIKFENAPDISSVLSVKIDDIHNFPSHQGDNFEAAFQFPFDQTFQAVNMMKVMSKSKFDNNSYLMDELLNENNFEIDDNSSILNVGYQNYQTDLGRNMLNEMIRNNQKLLLELKFNDKMYMTCIDLTIFNHPGVTDVNFLVPIYEWSHKLINDQFHQESCFIANEAEKVKKRSSKKSMNKVDSFVTEVVTSIINDGKYAALKVNVKLSKPLVQEQSLESLIDELNDKFPYKLEIKQEDFLVQQLQKDFHCIIYQMSNILEKFIDSHSNLNDEEILESLKKFTNSNEFCLKNYFKEALMAIIGNTFNHEEKTTTNHEFKLLMMKSFKNLNQKMNSILIERHQKKLIEPKVFLDENVRKWQIEEYIGYGNFKKPEELIERELIENFDEAKMREKALYLLKLKKYDELEDMLKKLFRVSRYCSFSLYILSYLCLLKDDLKMAIYLLKILTKLKPQSMEYWILMSNFYNELGDIAGVKFCSMKIQGTKFISNYKPNNSVIHPEIIFMDPISNILWHQFKFAVPKFYAITKAYKTQNAEWSIERTYIDIIELIELNKYQEALNILKEISIDDENEITLRILKGNILYEIKDQWKAICEYEIAFNLCLKFKHPFPLIPALRTGSWYLNELEILPKAKRYFSYCCDHFGTFESFMGLGRSDLKLMIYHYAENSFIQANLIDNYSSDCWILLALTSSKQKKFDIALNCYLTAKKLNVNESQEELIEVEKYLDI